MLALDAFVNQLFGLARSKVGSQFETMIPEIQPVLCKSNIASKFWGFERFNVYV